MYVLLASREKRVHLLRHFPHVLATIAVVSPEFVERQRFTHRGPTECCARSCRTEYERTRFGWDKAWKSSRSRTEQRSINGGIARAVVKDGQLDSRRCGNIVPDVVLGAVSITILVVFQFQIVIVVRVSVIIDQSPSGSAVVAPVHPFAFSSYSHVQDHAGRVPYRRRTRHHNQ